MKYIFVFLLILITNETIGQKYYLTKEAVFKLTNKLNDYKVLQIKYRIVSNKLDSVRKELNIKDSILYADRAKFDSLLNTKTSELRVLNDKYNRAIKQIPKRKRKLL
jgi:hypothetical protein